MQISVVVKKVVENITQDPEDEWVNNESAHIFSRLSRSENKTWVREIDQDICGAVENKVSHIGLKVEYFYSQIQT